MTAATLALHKNGKSRTRAPRYFVEYTDFASPIVFAEPCVMFEVVAGTDGSATITWTFTANQPTATGAMTELDLDKPRVFEAAGVTSVVNVTKLRVYF